MDLAASVQEVTEEIVIKLAKGVAKETGEKNLCLAGGVASTVLQWYPTVRRFDNIDPTTSGDAGGASAAYSAWYLHHKNKG